MGGFRLPENNDRSRLGEESRDEGLEERERGEMGLGWRQLGLSSETQNAKKFRYHRILLFHCFSISPVTTNMTTCRDDERQG